MSARTKINAMVIYGLLIVAALIGWACESWKVFFVAALLLIVLSLYNGNIRPSPRHRR